MIFKYLRANIKMLSMFLLFVAIFGIMSYIYDMPLSAVVYAAILCFVITAIYAAAGYIGFINKHHRLKQIEAEAVYTINNLQPAGNIIENDYCNIIKAVNTSKTELALKLTSGYSDLMDYYTMWAHQIKTPIAAMRLIIEGDDTDSGREIREELQKTEQYVEMALMYLKLDADAEDYVIKECSLDNIIKQAIKKYASQFIRKKIKLEYEPVCCAVITDEKWLLFVIEQIVSNSLKYTSTGYISIKLEDTAILCIKDTGIGIDASDIPRVFEKGFTGLNGRTDKKATGIGLYLCRRILSALGHKIDITSEVGRGTEVRIDLRRKTPEIE